MEAPIMEGPLGLIAGDGLLPFEIARAATARGRAVAAVAFRELTDARLADAVESICWVDLGQLQSALDFLRDRGVRDAVMAGKVSKTRLFDEGGGGVRLDERARAVLAGLADLRDDSLLGAIAAALEESGIRLGEQGALVPDLFAEEGVLGRVSPTTAQWRDVRFGLPIARAIAGLDIGQSVVVHERAVLAVEAIDGTDAAIRRAGKLTGAGLCIVKVAKPDQDLRFDLPAVGPETLAAATEARAGVLAFEAGRTIVLGREHLIDRADEQGIALVAVGPDGVPEPESER